MMQQQPQDMELSQSETRLTEYQSQPWEMKIGRSADIGELMLSLAKAQGQIGDIPRNRTVTVTPRSGGTPYQFKYATLSAIIDAIRKPLSDNGLGYTQIISHDLDAGMFYLTTTLYLGNQFIASKVPLLNADGGNQAFGSALTYMKRYSLAAMLGIAADEDDDGNAADGNEVKALSTPKPPAPSPIKPGGIKQASGRELGPEPVVFSPAKIDVPLLKDESGSDWMTWGKEFIAMARSATDLPALTALETLHAMPLKNMEMQAPKMYTNLTLALIKIKKEMEKKDA
jgi:hypothetical protein